MPARGHRKPPRPIGDPADPDGMGRAVLDHLAFRASLGQSEATLLLGRRELGYFVAWCAERDITKPVQVTRSVLERYRKWLSLYRQAKSGRPLALSSQRDRMCFVLLFFRWLAKQNRILINPGSEVELPLAEKRLPEVLTVAEVERVINQPDVTMALGVRDRAALETLYSTGMRRMELCGLDVRDVDLEQGLVRIRRGKGRKDRVIPIGARAVMWIRKYLDDVRPALVADEKEPALFLTRFGYPFSLSHMTTLCLAYKRAAGVEKRGSCHLFRHTAATQMLDNGADTRPHPGDARARRAGLHAGLHEGGDPEAQGGTHGHAPVGEARQAGDERRDGRRARRGAAAAVLAGRGAQMAAAVPQRERACSVNASSARPSPVVRVTSGASALARARQRRRASWRARSEAPAAPLRCRRALRLRSGQASR